MAKILIVDDSGLSRRMMRRILESAGYEVTEAPDGLTALETYCLDRPDVVLLDLTMSGMHGLEVLNKLRELDKHAVVVIASADIQTSTRALADASGARAFLTKPYDAQQVLTAIQQALAEEQG